MKNVPKVDCHTWFSSNRKKSLPCCRHCVRVPPARFCYDGIFDVSCVTLRDTVRALTRCGLQESQGRSRPVYAEVRAALELFKVEMERGADSLATGPCCRDFASLSGNRVRPQRDLHSVHSLNLQGTSAAVMKRTEVVSNVTLAREVHSPRMR